MKIHASISYTVYKLLSIFVFLAFLMTILYNIIFDIPEKVRMFSILSIFYFFALMYLQYSIHGVTVYPETIEISPFYFGKKSFRKNNCNLIKIKKGGFLFETYAIQIRDSDKKYRFITSKFMFNENMLRKIISD